MKNKAISLIYLENSYSFLYFFEIIMTFTVSEGWLSCFGAITFKSFFSIIAKNDLSKTGQIVIHFLILEAFTYYDSFDGCHHISDRHPRSVDQDRIFRLLQR